MNVLIIDPSGLALDWALRAQEAGHTVKWFIRSAAHNLARVGEGLVPKVQDWRPFMRWADLVFLTDNTLYMKEMAQWVEHGVPIFGATDESSDWELDRGIGQEQFAAHGIPTLPGKEFSDYDKAIAYVVKNDKRYVSKPSGDADKALSYVSKTPDDMVYMLERWKKLGKLKAPFILQEFVAGVEMAVGGWLGPHGFSGPWCENFEFKKLMNDDKGVATGEQGTVLWNTPTSKLARKVLAPLEEVLVATGHVGYVDVNCIIDDKGTPWPLEWTMRPGWPTFNIQQALMKEPIEWMIKLIEGHSVTSHFLTHQVAVGVVLAIPDYPYSMITRKEVMGVPIYGVTPKTRPRLHPCEIMRGSAPVVAHGKITHPECWVTAGDYVLVASGTGPDVLSAKRASYQLLDTLIVPNSPMYRTDIGSRLQKQLPLLHKHQYSTGLQWKMESSP